MIYTNDYANDYAKQNRCVQEARLAEPNKGSSPVMMRESPIDSRMKDIQNSLDVLYSALSILETVTEPYRKHNIPKPLEESDVFQANPTGPTSPHHHQLLALQACINSAITRVYAIIDEFD